MANLQGGPHFNRITRMMHISLVLLSLGPIVCIMAEGLTIDNTDAGNIAEVQAQLRRKEKTRAAEEIKSKQEAASRVKAGREGEVEQLNLLEDTTARFTVKELRISGNTLISTDELLKTMPLVYNTSNKPLHQAEPGDLYDLRVLHEIISQPGQPRKVSRRTMQGLTEYILSVYNAHDYEGIYVYISAQAVQSRAQLQDGLLPIEIVEAKISEIIITPYNREGEKTEKGILRKSVIEGWSPVKIGQMANRKKLDDFTNILSLNPDRYVSAVISRGSEPDSLALGYDVYEANPWHYYIQLDSSGANERQWAPRFGVINTNLTGRDDRITALYQASLDSIKDNYLMYGSYEFPLFTPRLHLNLYGGHSEFDISGGGGLDFLGRGSFYGSALRFNILQNDGWFFDVTSSLSRENSRVTPTLFATLETDIHMDLWGTGVDLHRSNDTSTTSLSFNRIQSIGGSSKADFVKARTDTDPHFNIYTLGAAHSRYFDPNRVQRLNGSLRWITSNRRLTPSKMTAFGGLYSVRGYEEDEIVADGGLLFSAQYEFDLVKYNQSKENRETESEETAKKRWLRKLALLTFIDFARAKAKDPVPGEKGLQELCSIGMGTGMRLGDNFDANIYYGWPLRSTADTRAGHGRWGFSFTRRW
ncbi:MAG: ShlB/FhaC/HecB family hemolysin secretion/activation protein [Planctomycetota bacterium]